MQLPVPPQPAAYFAQRPLKGNTQKSRLKTVENGVTLPELQGWLEPSGDPDSVCLRKLAADMGQGGGRTVQDPSFSFPGSSALGRGLCLAPVRVPRLRGDGCVCIRIQSIRIMIHCNPITPPLPLPQKPSLDADSGTLSFPFLSFKRRDAASSAMRILWPRWPPQDPGNEISVAESAGSPREHPSPCSPG